MDDPLQDVRVQDFIDDKLQSTTDLDHLDVLLASVELQRTQLQAQLDDATRELDDARRSGGERQASLARQIDDFNSLQRSIDVRLQIVASSDAPDEATRRLEPPLKKLHRVGLAESYLLLLQDVDHLREQARAHLPQDPKLALRPYSRLRGLAAALRDRLQPAADGAATHLVAHVGGIADALWDEMKRTMCAEMEAVLARAGWPRGVKPDTFPVPDEWRDAFEKLLDLQVPEVLLLSSSSSSSTTATSSSSSRGGKSSSSPAVVPILPIDVMAQIWVKEFCYHFLSDGERPMGENRLIGRHCFPWVLRLFSTWEDFLRDNFGFLLASKFAGTPVAGRAVYVDPVCALITSLLPVIREKVMFAADEAVTDPSFLSRLIIQLMDFDEELRDRFGYFDDAGADSGAGDVGQSSPSSVGGWSGLTAEVLDRHFAVWLGAEKDFALARFEAIMNSADARSIDYDYGPVSGEGLMRTKPTHGAVRVADLLKTVTSLYERAPRFAHKLRFLLDIQLAILDEFHDRLRNSLEAYYSLTSTVGRTLHGATKEELAALEGTGGLETLCKVYGSADHIANVLEEWSNGEFFVEFWAELQSRAKAAEESSADEKKENLAGGLSYADVKGRTSGAVGSEDDGGGVIFDETIAAYRARRKTAGEFLVSTLVESHRTAFKPYLWRAHWKTIGDDYVLADQSQMSITPELDEPLRIIKRNLDFLRRALGTAPFRRVCRDTLEKLNDMLWTEVLVRNHFTAFGAAQFSRDVSAISTLVEHYIPYSSSAETSSPFQSVQEGARLLSLPLVAPKLSSSSDDESPATLEAKVVTLKQATDRVFTNNEEAKKLLEELETDLLSPVNARHILQRRVENNE